MSSGHLVLLYAVELRLSKLLVFLYAVELVKYSGQLV